MHLDPYIVLGSAIGGPLVGITGAGGDGALLVGAVAWLAIAQPWRTLDAGSAVVSEEP